MTFPSFGLNANQKRVFGQRKVFLKDKECVFSVFVEQRQGYSKLESSPSKSEFKGPDKIKYVIMKCILTSFVSRRIEPRKVRNLTGKSLKGPDE